MEFHETPRTIHGIPWRYMELRGTTWHSMELHRHSMEFHGYSMELWHSWNSMELHEYSMELHEIHGIPWISMEVFHTGCLQ